MGSAHVYFRLVKSDLSHDNPSETICLTSQNALIYVHSVPTLHCGVSKKKHFNVVDGGGGVAALCDELAALLTRA